MSAATIGLGSDRGGWPGVSDDQPLLRAEDGLARPPSLTMQTFQACNTSALSEAWRLLLAAAASNPALESVASFTYDLVDVARQVLQRGRAML